MAQSPEYPDLRWIPPRSYTKGRPSHQCPATGLYYPGGARIITVHYTAGAEGYDDAEAGALYDQRRTDGVSSHYYVDADSVVHCVRTTDRAHTSLFHGNLWGIQYELCGTRQTRSQWLDTTSRRTIRNAARQITRDMDKYAIPLTRLVNRDLRARGVKGICGHADWTYGWPEDGGTHTDPGSEFPWDVLFDDIRSFRSGRTRRSEMLVLVRQKGHAPVWLSNLVTRRWVRDQEDLEATRAWAKRLYGSGFDERVMETESLASFGVVVGDLPSAQADTAVADDDLADGDQMPA